MRMNMTAIGIRDHQYKKLKTLNNFKSIIHLFMILYIGNILCRIMNSEDTVLVEFFAPWCPACVTFLPELEKLQEENWDIPMYKVGTLIMLGAVLQILVQVNTDENPELKAMFSVTTYPRVLLFTPGSRYEPLKYEKSWGLSFEPVNSWLKQQLD